MLKTPLQKSPQPKDPPPGEFPPLSLEHCPHLGVVGDPQTRFGFPSTGNHCHKVSPPQAIDLAHQGSYCLSSGCTECPVYQDDLAAHLPPEISASKNSRWSPLNWAAWIIALGAISFVVWYVLSLVFADKLPSSAEAQTAPQITAPAQGNLPLTGDDQPNLSPQSPIQAQNSSQALDLSASPPSSVQALNSSASLPSSAQALNSSQALILSATSPSSVSSPLSSVSDPPSSVSTSPTPFAPTQQPAANASLQPAADTSPTGPTAPPPSSTSPPDQNAATCQPPANWMRYTVRPGDTLSLLSRFSGASLAQIRTDNCLKSTVIFVGQQLYLPHFTVSSYSNSSSILQSSSPGRTNPTSIPPPAR